MNVYDQFDTASPLVGLPANGMKYSPDQMTQLNAARDALRAAEARGESFTYAGADNKPQGNVYDQFDGAQTAPAAPSNPDAALGGTLQLGVPFTNARLDTHIPLPASVEAGLVAAGKTTSDWINGVLHPSGKNAQVDADNAIYSQLEAAHPVSTFVGGAVPYLAAGESIPAMMGLAALGYGTPEERAIRAGAAGAGGLVGKGIGRLFGPQSMGAAATNDFGIPTTVGMNGSQTAKLAESVIANMPFVNGAVNNARNAAYQGFNRAVTNTFGQDSGKITPELLGDAQSKIGGTIGDIASRNNIAFTPELFTGLKQAQQDAATKLVPDQAKIVNAQVQNIINAVDPQTGTIPGTLYKAFQSDLGQIGKNNGGTLSSIMHDMRATMRDAMTASVSPEDSAAWLKANNQYFNLQQVANAGKSTPGSLSPAQLLQAVNNAQKQAKFGGGNDLASLAQFGKTTLTDQIPNSGTAQRALMQKILTNPLTGLGELAGLGYLANETGHPVPAAGLGLLGPLLIGRALTGSPASAATRNLLERLGGAGGLLGYNALASP